MRYRSSIFFILRLIANRLNEVEGCAAPAPARMYYEASYSEIVARYARARDCGGISLG